MAGFGVVALAVGLMFGGLHSGGSKPADAQVGQPAATAELPTSAVATSGTEGLTAAGLPSAVDAASSGTATTTRAPATSARSTPHPTAGTAPRLSPTPTPSTDSSAGGDDGIHLPKVNLPTFG